MATSRYLIVLIYLTETVATTRNESCTVVSTQLCRDRTGYFSVTMFRIRSCTMCYVYLFEETGPFKLSNTGLSLMSRDNSSLEVRPRPENVTSMKVICNTLGHVDCKRWTTCCEKASTCCTDQLEAATSRDTKHCPQTWDGYSCVAETPAGRVAQVNCPWFIKYADVKNKAQRNCTAGGTWWRDNVTGDEWTDYTTCISLPDIDKYRVLQILSMTCNALSIALLTPSIVIFLAFRHLRSQQRIRLHINLFISLLMTSMSFMLWEGLVFYDRLVKQDGDSFLHAHQEECIFLNLFSRLMRTMSIFWMLCEGFYLQWLMLKAFHPIKRTFGFYLWGYGVPLLDVLIYTILRLNFANDSECWINDAGGMEWVIHGPAIACIVINLVFFCIILRVLLTQLHTHPNEPSNYRKTLRATFILIPLFGLQQFFVIYSPDSDAQGFYAFEIASAIIVYSQGFLVALIFCFGNSEVRFYLRLAWRIRQINSRRSSARSIIVSALNNTLTSRRSVSSLPDTDQSVSMTNINGFCNTRYVSNEQLPNGRDVKEIHCTLEDISGHVVEEESFTLSGTETDGSGTNNYNGYALRDKITEEH